MARRSVLLRLRKILLARQARLHKKLAGELAYLHDGNSGEASGDSADLAFETAGGEISSRLAELDNRELNQIERALQRWKSGAYGDCACCQKPIPLARLSALPFAPFCIACERVAEMRLDGPGRTGASNWDQVADGQAPMLEQSIQLADLEREMSGSRRG